MRYPVSEMQDAIGGEGAGESYREPCSLALRIRGSDPWSVKKIGVGRGGVGAAALCGAQSASTADFVMLFYSLYVDGESPTGLVFLLQVGVITLGFSGLTQSHRLWVLFILSADPPPKRSQTERQRGAAGMIPMMFAASH